MQVLTPRILLLLVWPLPISLATTFGISVDVFSSPYLDVSVQAVPHVYLLIQYTLIRYCRIGFPHSDISGSQLICSSPKLFAAYHVLHRLLMPRHSPCALISLTFVRANCAHSVPAQLLRSQNRKHCFRALALTFGTFLDRPFGSLIKVLNYADSFVLPTKL